MSETYADLFEKVKAMDVHDFERWVDNENTTNFNEGKRHGVNEGVKSCQGHVTTTSCVAFTRCDDGLADTLRALSAELDRFLIG